MRISNISPKTFIDLYGLSLFLYTFGIVVDYPGIQSIAIVFMIPFLALATNSKKRSRERVFLWLVYGLDWRRLIIVWESINNVQCHHFILGKSTDHFSFIATQARWLYTISNSRKRSRICIIGFGNHYPEYHRNNRAIRRNNYNSYSIFGITLILTGILSFII